MIKLKIRKRIRLLLHKLLKNRRIIKMHKKLEKKNVKLAEMSKSIAIHLHKSYIKDAKTIK